MCTILLSLLIVTSTMSISMHFRAFDCIGILYSTIDVDFVEIVGDF